MTARRRGKWVPLLEGASRQRALEKIDAIDLALRTVRLDGDLADGQAGSALFHEYNFRAGGRQDARDVSRSRLQEAIEFVAQTPTSFSLYGGFCGVAWAIEHLEGAPAATGDDDLNDGTDDAVSLLLEGSTTQSFELLYGLSGVAIYLLERGPRPAATRLLEKLTSRLASLAESDPAGLRWFRSRHLLQATRLERFPNGAYNLGVSHGIAGVLGVLALAAERGLASATSMVEPAIHWLMNQQDTSAVQQFPSFLAAGARSGGRSAWCYGDPGIAAVLLLAARALGRADWAERGLSLARHAAQLPFSQSGVVDAGLCHGSAGLAHLFNRMYQETGDEVLRDASRRWFEQTLDMARPGEGFAGYLAIVPAEVGNERSALTTAAVSGFLTGGAGIGLSLLAAVCDVEPRWDRVLLLS